MLLVALPTLLTHVVYKGRLPSELPSGWENAENWLGRSATMKAMQVLSKQYELKTNGSNTFNSLRFHKLCQFLLLKTTLQTIQNVPNGINFFCANTVIRLVVVVLEKSLTCQP